MSECGHPMRDGPCQMLTGHKGRHASVVYWCDGCDMPRRSPMVAHAYDGNHEVAASFCWMCANYKTRKVS